ncbi:DNA photolyase, FAD-binding/Cryptochrome [Bisporella sp. PMI_857]|nr:DNA photolyase, FAD-binding/Cryptochrome [Bisporella sp. PMI_857]
MWWGFYSVRYRQCASVAFCPRPPYLIGLPPSSPGIGPLLVLILFCETQSPPFPYTRYLLSDFAFPLPRRRTVFSNDVDIRSLSGFMLRLLSVTNTLSRPLYHPRSCSSSHTTTSMPAQKTLVYLMRRDLRVFDNPVFHALSKNGHGFTHLLPLYVFSAKQIEVSGFIQGNEKSPFPLAKSETAGFWRCGPHRAKFLAESVWDLKEGLKKLGSDLIIQAGFLGDVITSMLKETNNIGAVWMTGEEGVEEKDEEESVKQACDNHQVEFKLWVDEKYLIDDRDLVKLKDPQDLPDVFTSYRKLMEPLCEATRDVLPDIDSLPDLPQTVTPQSAPLIIPNSLDGISKALLAPLSGAPLMQDPPAFPSEAVTVHPFIGGETNAHVRLDHLMASGAMTNYKDTRNALLGKDFSSKLSAYLAIGCITARQINASLKAFEDGNNDAWKGTHGYGEGENEGTKAMRFELLWRDYMRLCTRKFGRRLFRLSGFKQRKDASEKWSSPNNLRDGKTAEDINTTIQRFLNGTTGMGLIDASQRELFHTGYTSNRARQNVASFLAKHLYIDWRIGAEWYESMLVDYDLSSNWGNWQYVAGVGNDPRNEARVFNAVKQSYDYDPKGLYITTWMPELRKLENPKEIFQSWTIPVEEREAKGVAGLVMCENPLKRIEFTVGKRANHGRHGWMYRGFGRGRGGRGGGPGGGGNSSSVGNNHHNGYNSGRNSWRGGAGGQDQYTSNYGSGYSHGYNNSYNNFYGNGSGNGNRGNYASRGYGSTRGRLRGQGQGGIVI